MKIDSIEGIFEISFNTFKDGGEQKIHDAIQKLDELAVQMKEKQQGEDELMPIFRVMVSRSYTRQEGEQWTKVEELLLDSTTVVAANNLGAALIAGRKLNGKITDEQLSTATVTVASATSGQ